MEVRLRTTRSEKNNDLVEGPLLIGGAGSGSPVWSPPLKYGPVTHCISMLFFVICRNSL